MFLSVVSTVQVCSEHTESRTASQDISQQQKDKNPPLNYTARPALEMLFFVFGEIRIFIDTPMSIFYSSLI
jgi:hypothetical protein